MFRDCGVARRIVVALVQAEVLFLICCGRSFDDNGGHPRIATMSQTLRLQRDHPPPLLLIQPPEHHIPMLMTLAIRVLLARLTNLAPTLMDRQLNHRNPSFPGDTRSVTSTANFTKTFFQAHLVTEVFDRHRLQGFPAHSRLIPLTGKR